MKAEDVVVLRLITLISAFECFIAEMDEKSESVARLKIPRGITVFLAHV